MGGASGCGHSVWSVGGGYVCLIMKDPPPLASVVFDGSCPHFLFNVCKNKFTLTANSSAV